MNTLLSKFISAYPKSYTSSYVLICLVENWKNSLEEKKFVCVVLMDLPNTSELFESAYQNL